MDLQFRPAVPEDAGYAVALVRESGARALDYAYGREGETSLAFIRAAFLDGRGLLGWRNHRVAIVAGGVVAIGAFYGEREYPGLATDHAMRVLRHFSPWSAPGALRRSLHLRDLMPPPKGRMQYVAHFAVASGFRGRGIGASFLRAEAERARAMGRDRLALDVALDNPRGRAFYERVGFVAQRENRFRGPEGAVAGTLRMEALLDPAQAS